MTFEQAKRVYVHRYTMEHFPFWALQPAPNGKFYAPQYRTDQEWFENTEFPTNRRIKWCTSSNQSWPLGQWLDAPYNGKVGA